MRLLDTLEEESNLSFSSALLCPMFCDVVVVVVMVVDKCKR